MYQKKVKVKLENYPKLIIMRINSKNKINILNNKVNLNNNFSIKNNIKINNQNNCLKTIMLKLFNLINDFLYFLNYLILDFLKIYLITFYF